MPSQTEALDIIKLLGLVPHPEGGHYRETFRDQSLASANGRAASTAIYFLLQEGEVSHWHRVDAAETWHYYAGGPLELVYQLPGQKRQRHALGIDLFQDQRPQVVVPAGAWQTARPLGSWTMVGCTVAPGFEFAGFELAPPGFDPGSSSPDSP